jgi:hypothetical protein
MQLGEFYGRGGIALDRCAFLPGQVSRYRDVAARLEHDL